MTFEYNFGPCGRDVVTFDVDFREYLEAALPKEQQKALALEFLSEDELEYLEDVDLVDVIMEHYDEYDFLDDMSGFYYEDAKEYYENLSDPFCGTGMSQSDFI